MNRIVGNRICTLISNVKPGFMVMVIGILLTISVCCQAQPQERYLLALSKKEHTLAIVNAVTLKVIARVPVGPDPHEVIATDDGRVAYVSNTGGGRSSEINVIDLVGQKALPNINTTPLIGPHGLMFANGKVWFSAEGAKAVGRIDPATNQVDWSIGTGQERTHMVYATKDGKQVYTTNVNAGTVSILVDTLLPPAFQGGQARRDWVQTVIQVSKGSEGFDVTPDGRYLWTAAAEDGTISVIDLVSKKVTYVIDAKVLGANRLKFTPDGKRALVSCLRAGDLYVFDVASRKELKRLNIGHGGAGILVDDDGSRAFIGCTPDNYVAVVDLKKLEVIGNIDVGGGPDGLAWAVRPK